MSAYLFVVPPLTGHVNPTVAVAAELTRRGHQVAWVGHPDSVQSLLGPGAALFPATDETLMTRLEEARRSRLRLRGPAALRFLWEEFIIPLGHSMLPAVERAIGAYRPDVVVTDQQALAGAVAARRHGLPWVTSATTSAEFTRPLSGLPKVEEWVRGQIAGFQRVYGIDDAFDLRFSDHLVLVFTTSALVGDTAEHPEHYVFVGPALREAPEVAFPWEWLSGTRPAILVSLGTVNDRAGERFFQVAAEAVRGLELQAIFVAPPEAVPDPPPNVLVRARIPQLALQPMRERLARRAQHRLRGARAWAAAGRRPDPGRSVDHRAAGHRRRGRDHGQIRPPPCGGAARGDHRCAGRGRVPDRRPPGAAVLHRCGRRRGGGRPAGEAVMIWIPLLVGAALLLNAVRLRARLAPLRRIPATVETGAPAAGSGQTTDEYGLLTAPRVVLPVEFRQAAIAYARRERLEMLDLIPADLPVMAALDLARSVDAATYRADFTGPVGGAGFATLVKTDVLTRARLTPGPLDPGDYGAALRRLRKYTDAADLAVTRARSGPARSPAVVQRTRRAWTRGIGRSVFETTVGSVVGYGLVLLALAIEPVWGLLAVAAYCAVPYVVCTAGIPITPCDLHRAALLRPVLTPWSWWRTAVGREPRREASADTAAREARQWYRTELARGVERFLEPRRDDCPWCGSRSLRKHVTSGDIVLRKPGRFTLEKCQECGHVFQNPRLTLDGLTFYYRDFYDGPNGEIMELAFNGASSVHRARAELLSAHLRPKTWLDVGTAAGGFCRVARTVLPDTEFDGLDFGASVEEGERRGWLRRGFRGLFPDLVDDLAGRYDVISMYHYLEHTRDPFVELDTAVKVLGPGGHLLIELPDPESRFSRLLGRCWVPWLQPQHLNMIPIGNLKRALAARGMHIVAEQRRAAHSRCDFFLAALVLLHNFGPPGRLPWSSETTFGDRVRRKIAVPLMLPLGVAGLLVDRLAAPLIPGPGNAYRVLARKEEG